MIVRQRNHKFRIVHVFCGVGGNAYGSEMAKAAMFGHEAEFETVCGIDIEPRVCKDFEYLVGAPAFVGDIHTMQPADLRRMCGGGHRPPDVAKMSPPCKGNSKLLGSERAAEEKYQAMNRLFLESIHLLCATWITPPPLIFVENVPGIESRNPDLITSVMNILAAYGYVSHTGVYDCGELGGLAQHRKRWFLMARLPSIVPYPIFNPPKLRVRGCGEVIGPLPMPGDAAGGDMHELPGISLLNWIRLAMIPPGGDYRDLAGTLPEGMKKREMFRRHPVAAWDEPTDAVTGPGGAGGAVNVDDPRGRGQRFANNMPVAPWDGASPTVICAPGITNGAISVQDNRSWSGRMGVMALDDPSGAVTGSAWPNNGRFAVADDRPAPWQHTGGVTPWTSPSPTVTAKSDIHGGAFQVDDVRVTCRPHNGSYTVIDWRDAVACITGSLKIDNGKAAVADPRRDDLWMGSVALAEYLATPVRGKKPPIERTPPFVPLIASPHGGGWHRPLTTYELAMLQSFPSHVRGKPLRFTGDNHSHWRMGIGNAVPCATGAAIGGQLLLCLLAGAIGREYTDPAGGDVWVEPALAAWLM